MTPTTVQCPIHKKPIELKPLEGHPETLIAICQCEPGDRKWFGVEVLRRPAAAPAPASVSKPSPTTKKENEA